METLVEKNNKIVEHNVSNLYDAVLETENDIHDFVEFNEYTFNSRFIVPRQELQKKLDDLSLNGRRKLKKSINIFRCKKSVASANRFLHYLYKKVFKVDTRIKINYSTKHLLIQKKREIYKTYRAEMEKALAEYKAEKKDYYLARLQRGQKLQ